MTKIIEKHRKRTILVVENPETEVKESLQLSEPTESREIAVGVCPADMAQLRVEAEQMTIEQLLREYKALEAEPITGTCIWSLRYYFNSEEKALYWMVYKRNVFYEKELIVKEQERGEDDE